MLMTYTVFFYNKTYWNPLLHTFGTLTCSGRIQYRNVKEDKCYLFMELPNPHPSPVLSLL